MSACSSGYFLQGTTCYKCHESCAECSGYQDNDCLSCDSPYLFESGYCVTDCSKNTEIVDGNCESTTDNGNCNSS